MPRARSRSCAPRCRVRAGGCRRASPPVRDCSRGCPSSGRVMTDNSQTGKLAENIVQFGRALRRAGIAIGPSAVVDAIRAVEVAGIAGREDFYWTLHAIFVKRREHHAVFDEAFRLFWRSRKGLGQMLATQPETTLKSERPRAAASRPP